MPNWCTNEIVVTGPHADRMALHALIVKNHNVDFDVAAPIPNILKPMVVDCSKAGYEYNRVQPNRLGSLTPDAFIKRMAELHKTAIYNNIQHSEYDCYHIEQLDFEINRANRCVFIKERSIEDSIEAFGRSLWFENRGQSASGVEPIMLLIRRINHAMEKEYRDYRRELGYDAASTNKTRNDWCKENWGTKWNAENDGMEDTGTGDSYLFMTAGSPPTQWFDTVCEKAGELNLQVEIAMTYAERGNQLGGIITWLPNGGAPTETEMSAEDICEFLEIDIEEYNS